MINFNHFYYFHMTAKLGGVTAAARALRISQPSLSAQLKTLETNLGLRLFERVGRRLALSESGRMAYSYSRRMFDVADEFADFMRTAADSKAERIRIGASEEIERPFVVELVSGLFKGRSLVRQPRVTMVTGDHATLADELLSGSLDLLITNQTVHDRSARIVGQLRMPVVLAYSPALVRQDRRARQFAGGSLKQALERLDAGLVMPSQKLKLRHEAEHHLQRAGVRRKIVFESDLLAAVARALVDGVGTGLVPLAYVAKEVQAGQLRIAGPARGYWRHHVWLLTRQEHRSEGALRELLAAARARATKIEIAGRLV